MCVCDTLSVEATYIYIYAPQGIILCCVCRVYVCACACMCVYVLPLSLLLQNSLSYSDVKRCIQCRLQKHTQHASLASVMISLLIMGVGQG